MTLNEAEDIARQCLTEARRAGPSSPAELLALASEAIEYLLKELDEAERSDWSWGDGD